jgi:hypothetical protein
MDASIISALAALTGATVGGLTSGIAKWLNHRSQLRAQWLLFFARRAAGRSFTGISSRKSETLFLHQHWQSPLAG